MDNQVGRLGLWSLGSKSESRLVRLNLQPTQLAKASQSSPLPSLVRRNLQPTQLAKASQSSPLPSFVRRKLVCSLHNNLAKASQSSSTAAATGRFCCCRIHWLTHCRLTHGHRLWRRHRLCTPIRSRRSGLPRNHWAGQERFGQESPDCQMNASKSLALHLPITQVVWLC